MKTLKTRMAYTKKNQARYIAHLDLTRVFDRALRRAKIEVAYSEGFNPHPKIAFGPPLPVGVEGEREYVDIELRYSDNISKAQVGEEEQGKLLIGEQAFLREVAGSLQKQLPDGIELLDFRILPQGSKAIMAAANLARYRTEISFLEKVAPERLTEACQNWLAREEIIGIRYQKGKKTERNIRPFVSQIQVISRENNEQAVLLFDIVTGNAGSVRPVEVIESLSRLEGLPVDIPGVSTTRVGLYIKQADGKLLDPLTAPSGKAG